MFHFKHIDVSKDEEGLQETMNVSVQMGVAVIVIDQEVIVGFNRPKINAKLGL